jgi:hypothetical protein
MDENFLPREAIHKSHPECTRNNNKFYNALTTAVTPTENSTGHHFIHMLSEYLPSASPRIPYRLIHSGRRSTPSPMKDVHKLSIMNCLIYILYYTSHIRIKTLSILAVNVWE